jgi:hypothetical protein
MSYLPLIKFSFFLVTPLDLHGQFYHPLSEVVTAAFLSLSVYPFLLKNFMTFMSSVAV